MPVDSATLHTILGTPSYYRQFRAFAEREYNVENLDFLEAAAAYRRNPSKTRAIAILDRFVKDNSVSQVNISFTQREDVLTATSGYAASRGRAQRMGFFKRHWTAGHRKAAENVFDDAIDEVQKLVMSDTLHRFLQTPNGVVIAAAIEQRVARPGVGRGVLLHLGLS